MPTIQSNYDHRTGHPDARTQVKEDSLFRACRVFLEHNQYASAFVLYMSMYARYVEMQVELGVYIV